MSLCPRQVPCAGICLITPQQRTFAAIFPPTAPWSLEQFIAVAIDGVLTAVGPYTNAIPTPLAVTEQRAPLFYSARTACSTGFNMIVDSAIQDSSFTYKTRSVTHAPRSKGYSKI